MADSMLKLAVNVVLYGRFNVKTLAVNGVLYGRFNVKL